MFLVSCPVQSFSKAVSMTVLLNGTARESGGWKGRKKERKNERGTVQRNSTSMNPDHRTAWLGILDAGLSARILQSTVEYSLYARDGMKSRADVDGLRNAVNAPTKTDNSSIFGSGS